MALGKIAKKILKAFGSGDVHLITASISLTAGAPTILEGQGLIAATTPGTGQINCTLAQGYKVITVSHDLVGSSSLNSVVVSAKNAPAGTFQLTTVTSGSGTAVNHTGTIDLIVIGRRGGN